MSTRGSTAASCLLTCGLLASDLLTSGLFSSGLLLRGAFLGHVGDLLKSATLSE